MTFILQLINFLYLCCVNYSPVLVTVVLEQPFVILRFAVLEPFKAVFLKETAFFMLFSLV